MMGKLATVAGVDVDRAVFRREAGGSAQVSVFASSSAGQTIEARLGQDEATVPAGPGTLLLPADGDRPHYYGELAATSGDVPPYLFVSNLSDGDGVWKVVPIVDEVEILQALFDPETGLLHVAARSSDAVGNPDLELIGFPPLTFEGEAWAGSFFVMAPPPEIRVHSCAGGFQVAPVRVGRSSTGGEPQTQVVAQANPAAAISGEVVTLSAVVDGTWTTAFWRQTAGPTIVNLVPDAADPLVATFDAPNRSGTYAFEIVVQTPQGMVVSSSAVSVQAPALVAQVIAPQDAVRGAPVILDASDSLGASQWSWSVEGVLGDGMSLEDVSVLIEDATSPVARFNFPLDSRVQEIVIRLEVGDGVSTDEVTFSVLALEDTIVVDSATFRARRSEWRIEGTVAVGVANQVTIFVDGVQLASVPVDPTGEFSFRERNSPVVPNANSQLRLESRAGGLLEGVGVTID